MRRWIAHLCSDFTEGEREVVSLLEESKLESSRELLSSHNSIRSLGDLISFIGAWPDPGLRWMHSLVLPHLEVLQTAEQSHLHPSEMGRTSQSMSATRSRSPHNLEIQLSRNISEIFRTQQRDAMQPFHSSSCQPCSPSRSLAHRHRARALNPQVLYRPPH